MATDPEDDAAETKDTAYPAYGKPGAKPGFVLSAWSLALGGIALLLIISGLLLI